MTSSVRVATHVGVPATRAWALLTDWERHSSWIYATRVRSVDGDRVGGRIDAFTGLGPLGFLDVMRINRWEPPWLCEVAHTGRLVRGAGAFRVEPVGSSACRVVWEEHPELPLGAVGRLGWVVVRPLAKAGLALALRRFARLCAASARS